MLIRAEQMEVFEQAALRQFEDEMVAHSKSFSPRLCEVIGDEQLRVALRAAMERAGSYGFTNRGPIRLFIELMFLCGSAFDTDPQYSKIAKILRASSDQMQRAEQMHQGFSTYLDDVAGPENENVRTALKQLSKFAGEPLRPSPAGFEAGLLQEMSRIFPQKAAYVGESDLKKLIQDGIAEARKYGFTEARQITMIVALMFAFGHGCTHDPLYPWITRTLQDEKITGPAARAERLEKKARTWLEHVLARYDEGLPM
jgi:hypothetical protein